MPITSAAADTQHAVERMCADGVDAIVVLGGDATHRVVAKACGDVPICALSTGTDNVFPEMRETTWPESQPAWWEADALGPMGRAVSRCWS